MAYQLTWITPALAVGSMPISFADLDAIREQGVDAIVNLCGEFCDLHEIERQSGFEVYFLPIPDETTPDMAALEAALAWLDEAVYLGKKVLVHCRHGIGRTGTFVTAYLLRRGLGLKLAGKTIAHSRALPASYVQWRFLKRYGKESGTLTIREPRLEQGPARELAGFLVGYEALVREVEEEIAGAGGGVVRCGAENDACCGQPFRLGFIEAVALGHQLDRRLTSGARQECIAQAAGWVKRLGERGALATDDELAREGEESGYRCPLSHAGRCRLYGYRPLRCRLHGVPAEAIDRARLAATMAELSAAAVAALGGQPTDPNFSFTSPEVLSGRFVERYFHALADR